MTDKPKVLISFRENGENGGPFVSHERIMNSSLAERYDFHRLQVPLPAKLRNPKNLISFAKSIKAENPNLVHFTGLQLEGFWVCVALRLAGVKNSVLAIRGSSLDAMNFKGPKREILRLLEGYTLNHVKWFYCVSNFVAGWENIKGRKNCFGTIYNLLDNGRITDDAETVRERLGISKDAYFVVSTGRIIEDKGYAVLSDVCDLLDWETTKAKIVIVGDGNYLDEMKRRSVEGGWSDRVVFTGYVPQNTVRSIVSASDLFVSATFHETFGNSVAEASTYGVPVVVSKAGGVLEIVEDNVSGILVEPGDISGFVDGIEKLAKNRELSKKLGCQGKDLVETRFSERSIAEKIGQLYEICLSE